MSSSTPEGNSSFETASPATNPGLDDNHEAEEHREDHALDGMHPNTESIPPQLGNTPPELEIQDDDIATVAIHREEEEEEEIEEHPPIATPPTSEEDTKQSTLFIDLDKSEVETEKHSSVDNTQISEIQTHETDTAIDSDISEIETSKYSSVNNTQVSEIQANETDTAIDSDISEIETSKHTSSEDLPINDDKDSNDDKVDEQDTGVIETKNVIIDADVPAKSEEMPLIALVNREPSFEQSAFAEQLAAGQKRQRRVTRYWMLSAALLFLLLAAILTPLIVLVSYGVNAYATYNLLRAHAYSGIDHLSAVKTIFTQTSTHSTSLLDETRLKKANGELVAAHDDFVQVQAIIKNTSLIYTITNYIPEYRPQVESVQAASQIAIDGTLIGEQVLAVALKLAPGFQGPLLGSASTPLLTAPDIDLISHTVENVMPLLNNIQTQSHNISLDALPISSTQRTQMQEIFQLLPQVQTLLQQGRELLTPISWLLGIGQPRTFLVQTMDRAELRATGGFTGQYGELSLNGGRAAPFSLHDISNIEYAANSPTTGQSPPAAYTSWWPFANWGLRDSNLSADFPTSARIAIAEYKAETNRSVDGVITFSPFFIEHILQVIGPLQIPRYNETVTAQNLEGLLHYYQLDNAGIRKIELIEHITNGTDVRKYFTSQVAQVLMERVRHASPSELLAIGTQMLQDLKTKDLQVYFTNPDVENLLAQYGYDAAMNRSNTHDGLYIVQMNVSASKASQYVQTNLQDTVKLDANGGATHTMVIHLIYNQIGPVYGLDTYRDYIRIYVPESAHLLSGDGFDTGQPLCGGPFGACSPYGIYPHQEMVCPVGQYNAGASAPMIGDPYAQAWHPLDEIGPPNNTVSDEPGKAMFGGYVVIPKNCSMTVTVSWYVPPLSHGNYDLLFQRQSSTFPTLDLTVIPAAKTCPGKSNELHFNGIITSDTSLALNPPSGSSAQANSGSCSLVTSSP